MPNGLYKIPWRWLAAVIGAACLGYLLRDFSSEKPQSAGRAPWPSRTREIRPMDHPVGSRELNIESQQRLRDLQALAARDPQAALRRLPAFRDSELLPLALTALARGWAQNDPQACATWVEGLESSEDQVSAALGLVPVWAASAAEPCLAWASAQAAGNLREVSLVEIADAWVANAPDQALTRFLALKSEAGTERGLHVITAQWALDQPDQAIAYVAALPPEQRRDEFLETVLVSLTNQEPDRVWKEATRFDDAKRLDHVRAMALEAISETRPQVALNLAASVGNPPALLKAIARGWTSQDAAAAQAWIATLQDAALADSLRALTQEQPEPTVPNVHE